MARPWRKQRTGFQESQADREKTCWHFLKGRCKYGDSCKYSHTSSDSRRSTGPRQLVASGAQHEDKLGEWKRMLPHEGSSGFAFQPSAASVATFFKLALELMNEDIGASQDIVKLLNTDAGLEYIKAVTDRHILTADRYPAKVILWKTQIAPLFRLISHRRVIESNVLEQQVAEIHSFFVGRNATRMSRVFNLTIDLATSWHDSNEEEGSRMSVIELSLGVLYRIVDCNSTNIINDDFHRIIEKFAGLVDVPTQPEEEFFKLQAKNYLQYLQRRLGVGKDMAEYQNAPLSVAKNETFVLRRDLPGRLSADGPRHDNDHKEIYNIAIMPTYQEIISSRSEYLPTTDSSQWHVPGILGRLDREFRLLREDTIGQLRDAVRHMLEHIHTAGYKGLHQSKNSAKTSVYADATVDKVTVTKNKGLRIRFKCRQPDTIRKMNSKQRQLWWEQCKRLQPGALVCVIDSDGVILFYVVADSPLGTPEPGQVNQAPSTTAPELLNLSSNAYFLYVTLKLVSSSPSDIGQTFRWYRDFTSNPRRYLVEFPGVLLESFKHTLEALQSLSQKPDVPFTDLIAPEKAPTITEATIPTPLYACAPNFNFDVKCLTKDQESFPVSITNLPAVEDVSSRTGLDLTQSKALLNTLTRGLSLIQGPPGTGKSYTGEKIINVLLANKEKVKLGPIICVCYTNHALDQLLGHLMNDGIKSIIRMGSRSKSERLQEFSLRAVSKNMSHTKNEKKLLWEIATRLQILECSATGLLEQLSRYNSPASVREFLQKHHRVAHDQLWPKNVWESEEGWRTVQHTVTNPIATWLRGGSNLSTMTEDQAEEIHRLESVELAALSKAERQRLYQNWLKELRDPIIAQLISILRQYDEAIKWRKRIHQEADLRCLQQADIIGVTTTVLARELDVLRKLPSKVLFCEEAGEVLEAQILTTLLPSIQHAILIGDHLQLRPQIQNYDLQSSNPRGIPYSLDMSLFERLVQPPHSNDLKLPVSVLETQRRMHPSIAEMVRSTLYNSLKDSENVGTYPPVMGMRHRLFWLHHEKPEFGAADQDPHSSSHSNAFEIEMTTALVSHIVRQGHYALDDIAVLTPYLGQLQKLRSRMAVESTFAVNIGERDLEDLEAINGVEADDKITTKSGSIEKTTLLKSVRLATVDNFQGEEAKVVIISLVRSNPGNRCGFLSTSNRINVLLSRAKHGCYIIGNSNTYCKVPMWRQILQLLQANGNFGKSLPLQCARHPETPLLVSEPDDFLRFSPDAGCRLPCDRRLDCGHSCTGPCHSDMLHKAHKCHEKCLRVKKGCDHPCPRECGDPCEEKCQVVLSNINLKLSCGHIAQSVHCWKAQNSTSIRCVENVRRQVPGCNHTLQLPCYLDVEHSEFKCKAICGHLLTCGHQCQRECYRCNTREGKEVVKIAHGTCQRICGRQYTNCHHTCASICHGTAHCGPCTKPCEVRCSHSRCDKLCHEPCAPCAETCASSCPHVKCAMPCAAPCDLVPCSKRCELKLVCGHQCPSLCGETCPEPRFCQHCASEDVLSTNVDLIEGTTYKDIDLDEDPCVFPDCGHFLAKTSMDGQMGLHEHYEMDKNGIPIEVKTSIRPPSIDEVKFCYLCRGSLRNINRYGRLVRRAMLDEATKKLIAWSHSKHLYLHECLLKEQERMKHHAAELPQGIGTGGLLDLGGSLSSQVQSLGNWVGRGRYKRLAQLLVKITQYKEQVKVEEQPFQKVADFVRHAKQKHETLGAFSFDGSIVQLRGYLLATSLMIKCTISVVSDFMDIWTRMTLKPTNITGDFSQNLALCQELIKLAAETDRPRQLVEGHIYCAQLCGFALVLGAIVTSDAQMKGAEPEHSSLLGEKVLGGQPVGMEALKKNGLESLDKARALLVNREWPEAEVKNREIEHAARMLNEGIFYQAVTSQELLTVYRAMKTEFSGTGHWYTCASGHPFTVGECGMPMEQARCPECGSAVGGQSHQPAQGVRRADEIEGLDGEFQALMM